MVPDWHQAPLGRKGPESLRGGAQGWSGDREELGSDKQVVLQGSASYVHDKGGPVERMVGKHRAWRTWLEHSLLRLVCQLLPRGLHICPSLPRNQKSVLLCEVVWFLCQPQVKFLGNIVQTWPLGHQCETPGLHESRLEQESPSLGGVGAGSFPLEAAGRAEEGVLSSGRQ